MAKLALYCHRCDKSVEVDPLVILESRVTIIEDCKCGHLMKMLARVSFSANKARDEVEADLATQLQ